MNLLEMNTEIIFGKKTKCSVPELTEEHLIQFKKLINISKSILATFESIDDANSFFTMYPDIKVVLGSSICVEAFYACKLGYYYKGIPTKLVYILNKTFKENDNKHINTALNTAINLIKPYISNVYEYNGEDYTVKDIIENVVGTSINLITDSKRKIKCSDCWEVYIPDIERVALFPNDIADMFGYADCEKLYFTVEKGIMFNDTVVRTLGNRLGITKNDFDLRDCV